MRRFNALLMASLLSAFLLPMTCLAAKKPIKGVVPPGTVPQATGDFRQQTAVSTNGSAANVTVGQPTGNLGPESLVWLETTLLGSPRPMQPVLDRISTLETLVFGSASPNDAEQVRLARLETSVRPAYAKAQAWTEASNAQEAPAMGNAPTFQPAYPHQSPINDTPVVDEMEQQAYGQVFRDQSLDIRLARLEKRYLGTVQRGDYASRVDNLRWLVLGGVGNAGGGGSYTSYTPDQLTETGQQYGVTPSPYATRPGMTPGMGTGAMPGMDYSSGYATQDAAAMADMTNALNQLEHDILKANYGQDPIPVRLGRLEQTVFSQSAEGKGLSDDQRLQRLMAVAVAEKDSEMVQQARSPMGQLKNLWPLLPVLVLMLL